MYYIPKTLHIRLDKGSSVVLSAGPRGPKVEHALGPREMDRLLEDGSIEVRPDPE